MKKVIIILAILILFIFLGFIVYSHMIFKNNLPILAYHDVLEKPLKETDISLKNFESQMKYVSKHYKTLSLNEFYDWKNGKELKGKKVLLTFDDGKESFYTKVVPILEKYHLKATIFVIQSAIDKNGYLTTEQIMDLKKNHKNIDIASHSFNLHLDTLAKSNDYSTYDADMKLNQENNYKYYAYPFGISNDLYIEALKNNHYQLAFLFSPSKWAHKNDDNYKIPRVPIYKSNSLLKFKLKLALKI